ncbi:YggS family pyridoxal phosphate-dependent enzyme [Candidatus Poriferisocius sp.]|uniref:YggS family pyridoxal phosphate-dependent enzyme n=1 Tax=Candidatus Poriferisocius sp. TaxID=3101276 RepID=UPI003B58F6EF
MLEAAEVAERLSALRERLARVGGDHVQVVAVTKGFGPEAVAAATGAGLSDLGENYAQELLSKAATTPAPPAEDGGPRWHFIGRLQRNKIRKIAGVVHLWQSVDRPEVAEEIARRAPGARVLVQVDVARTGGRGGCLPEDTESLVARGRQAGLAVAGLMAVGPPGPPEDARPGFRLLAAQARELGLGELSMGMSADIEVAVEEGATMIRVGTALFGPRPA